MRYFDADDTAIKLDPKAVIAFSVAVGAGIMAMNFYYGLWP